MIIEQQSFAYDVREQCFKLVSADPFFAGYTCRKTKMQPVQAGLIPYLGVYILPETMVPDGDANAGMIRFSHTAVIGFSVIIANNDQNLAEKTIDQALMRIMSALWTDKKLMNVFESLTPEGVLVESITRGTRRHVFGATGTNNETPFAELQYEVSAFSRSEWYPDITDTLDEIDVTTGIKLDETQAERDQRQQAEVVYDFTDTKAKENSSWLTWLRRFRRPANG